MSRQSYVYFIKPIGIDGPIKIGCSQSPKGRLISLSVWSPWPLEIIGTVRGTCRDEAKLHNQFQNCHSHREWFHPTPLLVTTIAEILKAGDFGPAIYLPVVGPIRNFNRRPLTENVRRRVSYAGKIRWTQKRMRQQEGDRGSWCMPDDIRLILDNWLGSRECSGVPPSTEEMFRIDEYLLHPEIHSIRCKYFSSPAEISVSA